MATLNEVSYDELATALQGTIDGKVEQHYSTSDPSSTWTTNTLKDEHVGGSLVPPYNKVLKVWVETSTNNYSWQTVEDQAAIAAAEAAEGAQDTADGKRRVFVATPTTPYDAGDLWDRGATTGLYRANTSRASTESFSSGDWQAVVNTNRKPHSR